MNWGGIGLLPARGVKPRYLRGISELAATASPMHFRRDFHLELLSHVQYYTPSRHPFIQPKRKCGPGNKRYAVAPIGCSVTFTMQKRRDVIRTAVLFVLLRTISPVACISMGISSCSAGHSITSSTCDPTGSCRRPRKLTPLELMSSVALCTHRAAVPFCDTRNCIGNSTLKRWLIRLSGGVFTSDMPSNRRAISQTLHSRCMFPRAAPFCHGNFFPARTKCRSPLRRDALSRQVMNTTRIALLSLACILYATEPNSTTRRWWAHVQALSNDGAVGRVAECAMPFFAGRTKRA